MNRTLVVPAAGLGTRLHSALPKLLTPVAGKAMLDHVLDLHGPFVDTVVIVVHPGFAGQVADHLGRSGQRADLVIQPSPTGMLDAILLAQAAVARAAPDRVWVTWCDQIAISRHTLQALDACDRSLPSPALALLTARQTTPYIHFDRDASQQIVGVRQRREGDVMPTEGESDAGVFSFSMACFANALPAFASGAAPGAVTGERNLLPFVAWIGDRGEPVATVPVARPIEARGINTPEDLAAIGHHLASRMAQDAGR